MQLDTQIYLADWLYLLRGAGVTVLLCAVAMMGGTLLGVVVGVARASNNPLLTAPAGVYVNIIRGTPLLMQLFFLYYVLPLVGINLPQLLTAFLGLSIYAAAYVGEIVKAGLQSVDVGQREAAQALGLRPLQVFRYVVMPQALSVIIPPAFGFFIALIKDSSLVSIIGFIELTKASKLVISRTFQPFIIYLGAAVLYFIICFSLSRFEAGYLRRKFSRNPVQV